MINLYYHVGSANHGCEAIIRSTAKILHKKLRLFSKAPETDYQYGLDSTVEVFPDTVNSYSKKSVKFLLGAVQHKLFNDDFLLIKNQHESITKHVEKGSIWLSVGGDNYCYQGVESLEYYNRMIHQKGGKTILWGCSINPDILTKRVINDLKSYNLITVRESLTYKALQEAGITENTILCVDSAFQLDTQTMVVPPKFIEGETIGINISPLIMEYGTVVMENYKEMIRCILETTDYSIALIPHVVFPDNDDRIPMKQLKEAFPDNDRVVMVEDGNCMQLKWIISRCRMFIGARTHATIAAYSSSVPTLVIGYSVKSKGIAKDIFGTDKNYVVSVQDLDNKYTLRNAFVWLHKNEKQIRQHLIEVMPGYCNKTDDVLEALNRLIGKK